MLRFRACAVIPAIVPARGARSWQRMPYVLFGKWQSVIRNDWSSEFVLYAFVRCLLPPRQQGATTDGSSG